MEIESKIPTTSRTHAFIDYLVESTIDNSFVLIDWKNNNISKMALTKMGKAIALDESIIDKKYH